MFCVSSLKYLENTVNIEVSNFDISGSSADPSENLAHTLQVKKPEVILMTILANFIYMLNTISIIQQLLTIRVNTVRKGTEITLAGSCCTQKWSLWPGGQTVFIQRYI